jgi:signal transduction histidine kinase
MGGQRDMPCDPARLDDHRALWARHRESAHAHDQPHPAPRQARSQAARADLLERRRLGRDLHDGVQNDLVAVIVELALAQEHPDASPALGAKLARIEARAKAALDSVRDIARGMYPSVLSDFGVPDALRAQAARATVEVSVLGAAPRSIEEAEEAVYFACSEAIQNAAKHAGSRARVEVTLAVHDDTLVVRIADDGRGFDVARTPEGAGLQIMRGRMEDVDGTLIVDSQLGRGTVLTLALPWPIRSDRPA